MRGFRRLFDAYGKKSDRDLGRYSWFHGAQLVEVQD